MKLRYDFAVYDENGRLSALFEAKRRFKTTADWARRWHETATAESSPIDASIVLVSPDVTYVWLAGAAADAEPDAVLDSKGWLGPYFERLNISSSDVEPTVFEDIVWLWLQDVVDGRAAVSATGAAGELRLDALRGGQIVHQVAA